MKGYKRAPGKRLVPSIGSFTWIPITNEIEFLADALAYSLPYGVYAPAEVYNLHQRHGNRADLAYFSQAQDPAKGEIPRVEPPRNILQRHIGTASSNTDMSGLTELYRQPAGKVKTNEVLTAMEENFISYYAVQLTPIEPNVEYQGHHDPEQGFLGFGTD